jgi:DHA1 family bicyclomycin/chloramphenicol resistance-like MFS transporter
MGTLQFMTGALVMALVGLFVDGTARPMLAGIAGSAVVALVLARLTLGKAKPFEVLQLLLFNK